MSYRAVTAICVAFCCVALVAGGYQLPATIKTCKRDADDFASCLRLAIQESWPTFLEGIPELDMPVLDPYLIDNHVTTYDSGLLRGNLNASNVRTYGFKKSHFLSVKPELINDLFHLEVDMEVPKMLIEGEYEAEGSLGSFQIGGTGFFNFTVEDIQANWNITGHIVDDIWVVEHFILTPEVGYLKFWFSDLFHGNMEMNNAAIFFANEYWPTVYRGMLPYLKTSWDPILTELTNRFFSKIPFSTVFP
ncbi:circadian clock-controlled protein daywake [Halictus rubicundus]|uniref:circadian clock-controlled protein daywake n=1 Tax=Halictus rubicundus TaxID=77578 RepID=UPI004035AAE0